MTKKEFKQKIFNNKINSINSLKKKKGKNKFYHQNNHDFKRGERSSIAAQQFSKFNPKFAKTKTKIKLEVRHKSNKTLL